MMRDALEVLGQEEYDRLSSIFGMYGHTVEEIISAAQSAGVLNQELFAEPPFNIEETEQNIINRILNKRNIKVSEV